MQVCLPLTRLRWISATNGPNCWIGSAIRALGIMGTQVSGRRNGTCKVPLGVQVERQARPAHNARLRHLRTMTAETVRPKSKLERIARRKRYRVGSAAVPVGCEGRRVGCG